MASPAPQCCVEDFPEDQPPRPHEAALQPPAEPEYDFLEHPSQEYYCPVTLELLRNPRQTACCGHHISQEAASRLQREQKRCPMCNELNFMTMMDKFFKRKVNELKVRCPHKGSGCGWVGELINLEQHANSCPKRPWECEHCDFKATYEVCGDHVPLCKKYPIPCPNQCEIVTVPRSDLETHLSECPLQLVECEFSQAGCKEKVPRRDLASHVKENAQQHLLSMSLLNLTLTRELRGKIEEKDRQIAELQEELKRQSEEIEQRIQQQLQEMKREGKQQVTQLQQEMREQGKQATQLEQGLKEQWKKSQQQVTRLQQEMEEQGKSQQEFKKQLQELKQQTQQQHEIQQRGQQETRQQLNSIHNELFPKQKKEKKEKGGGAEKQVKPEKKEQTPKKKEQPKEEHDIPKEPKLKDPYRDLPKSSFDLDQFKRVYSNEDTATKAIPHFWENFDKEGWSLWRAEYKYPEDLKYIFMSSNLVSGMFQRLDKMRNYAFASVLILGQNNDSRIAGVWVMRGQELAFSLVEDWNIDAESYEFTKLDPDNPEHRKTVDEFFLWEGDFGGKEVADGKIYK